MGYWRGVFARTWRDTAESVGLGTREKVLVAFLSQGMIALIVYFALGPDALKASEPVRLIAAAAPFAIFPVLFALRLSRTPAILDLERREEIEKLTIASRSAEEHKERRRSLGRLLSQCDDIKRQCEEPPPVNEHMVEEWFARTQKFLVEDFGEEYLHLFLSDAGIDPLVITDAVVPERNKQLWAYLYKRGTRLKAFLEAMPDRPA
jgi:hypothetical protein